ncbi:Patatin-like phospholipase [Entamoeba marina]
MQNTSSAQVKNISNPLFLVINDNHETILHILLRKNPIPVNEVEDVVLNIVQHQPSLFNQPDALNVTAFDLLLQYQPDLIPNIINVVSIPNNLLTTISASENPAKSYSIIADCTANIPSLSNKIFHPNQIPVSPVRWYSNDDRRLASFNSEYNAIIGHYKPSGLMHVTQNLVQQNKYRIISLDGGGVKALLQLYVLKRLEDEHPGFLSRTALFCGVSASSIICTQLSLGCNIELTIKLFELMSKSVFVKRTFGGTIGPLYSSYYLKYFLNLFYNDMRLDELPRQMFFISVCANPPRLTPRIFHNFNSVDGNIKIVDACMMSSSAPIYFDSYDGHLDGALFENNPVTCAFPLIFGRNGFVKPQDTVCFSISTGAPDVPYLDNNEYNNAGFLKWAPRTLDLFQYSRRDMSTTIGKELLGDRFFRLDPKMPNKLRLDNVEDCEKIAECGKTIDISELDEWVIKHWMS